MHHIIEQISRVKAVFVASWVGSDGLCIAYRVSGKVTTSASCNGCNRLNSGETGEREEGHEFIENVTSSSVGQAGR